MIELVTGRKQNFYVGVRGNTTRTFDVYKNSDGEMVKIRTYTGQAELFGRVTRSFFSKQKKLELKA